MKYFFKNSEKKTQLLSVVVISYNMQRELPRTLFSLSKEYQQGILKNDYEVLVVENGSTKALSPRTIKSFGTNFKYFHMPDPKPSPASALNFGASQAKGKYLGIIIDGARILSPGILRYALAGFKSFKNPLIYTLGWHLGYDVQNKSIVKGYNQKIEDRLLKKIKWRENGYRLFDISTIAGNSKNGWFQNCNESNCFFLKKHSFIKIGGYDERFDKAGGGMCNHDFFHRACDIPDSDLVVILGEGTFHQIHNGIAANNPDFKENKIIQEYRNQYQVIRGKPFSTPKKSINYVGHIPAECNENFVYSAVVFEKKSTKMHNQLKSFLNGKNGEKRSTEESLGLEFKPGERHYRAYIGPPQNYDLIAAMSFNLLTTFGLRQYHSILDIGCGSLRVGRLLIPYLNSGKYTGIEPNEWLVKEGIKNEIGEDLINIKKPNFYFDDNLCRLKEGLSFDFAFAQSIFSHCTIEKIKQWLEELSARLKSEGVFLATFVKGEKDFFNKAGVTEKDFEGKGWIYPKIVSYKPETMAAIAQNAGFHFQILDWKHPRQTWALFSKPGYDTSWFKNDPLTWNTTMQLCPSFRATERKNKK